VLRWLWSDMKKYRLFALTAAISLILDQLSKIYIDNNFALSQSKRVVTNFFHITYVRNPGAAFGILSDSAIRLPFFIGISLIATLGIFWYIRKVSHEKHWQHLSLGLILSGALGNLIDRLRLGEVIDFIDVHWYNYHWPAFNLADSAICVGVGIMLVCTWDEERAKKRPPTNQS
jgi:signal peptidase II